MQTPALLDNSFEHQLRHIRKGGALTELSQELQKAVMSVKSLNKKATLTLTLNIEPFGDGTFAVTDDIKVKLPTPSKGHTLFYSTDDNRLVRENPEQTEMRLVTQNQNEQQTNTAAAS